VAGNYATALAVRFAISFILVSRLEVSPLTDHIYLFVAQQESESLIHGWEIWMQEANQHDLVIGTETIGFNVSVFDIGGSYDTTLEETTKIARGDYGDFDFIFGTTTKSLWGRLTSEPPSFSLPEVV
jgi:hypothetical protein